MPSWTRTSLLAAGVAVLVAAPRLGGSVQGQVPEGWGAALERFAETLEAEVVEDGTGGITAGVAVDGDMVWSGGFGWADREARVPAGPGTIYRVGSISKSFTAVLMAILVDDGVLELDMALDEIVPEVLGFPDRPPAARPTLRQVASHTAGLVREPDLPGAATGRIGSWKSQVLRSIPLTRYQSAPGTEYSYSNIGFGILGFGLERAGGSPFIRQVHDRITAPLGMTSTTFVIDEALRPRLAKGYANGGDGPANIAVPANEHLGRGYKVPNGGVYSTVADLARFAAGVMGRGGRDLLSGPVRAQVLSDQTPGDGSSGYGLGFQVVTAEGRSYAGHGGSVAGYTAFLLFEPTTGITVVLLRNYNRGRTDLGDAAAGLLAELTVPAGV